MFLGPSPSVNLVWSKSGSYTKNECDEVFNICPKKTILKEENPSLTILCFPFFSFFLFSWFSFVFTFLFSKYDCNEREHKKTYFVMRIRHVFVYVCQACC